MGMIQKQGNWVPYELKPRDVERRLHVNSCLKGKDGKGISASHCDWERKMGSLR